MALKILQFGRTGQVGMELLFRAARRGHQVTALGRDTVDLANPSRVPSAVSAAGDVDLVINGAAYTAVDKAETEFERAKTVNVDSVALLAEACAKRKTPLVHLSTDYVFDGMKQTPYVEDDATAPLNAYGRTKLMGEGAVRARQPQHIILRTSWVYSAHGNNFVKTMLRLGAEREELRIVDDQWGAPTSAGDIADACLALGEAIVARGEETPWGTYHYTSAGAATWRQFAQAIFASAAPEFKTPARVVPIASADYPTPAKRPLNSRLDCSKIERAFGIKPRPWQDGLAEVMAELKAEKRVAQ